MNNAWLIRRKRSKKIINIWYARRKHQHGDLRTLNQKQTNNRPAR